MNQCWLSWNSYQQPIRMRPYRAQTCSRRSRRPIRYADSGIKTYLNVGKKRLTMANLVLMAMFCKTLDAHVMFLNVFLTGRPCQEQEPVVDEGKPWPGGISECYQENFKRTAKIKGLASRDGQTSKMVEEEGEGGWRETSQKSRWDHSSCLESLFR